MNETSQPQPDPSAESVLAAWISHGAPGQSAGFEKLVRSHPELSERLRELHQRWTQDQALTQVGGAAPALDPEATWRGEELDPKVQLSDEGEDFTSQVMERLSGRSAASGRYRLKGKISQGGMGVILRVWDEDLRRHLAMKVMLGAGDPPAAGLTPGSEQGRLARFLEEAQITGQLDHPGIVPVHEMGIESRGQVYFTMKLVKGRDLKAIFDLLRDGGEGWTLGKALRILLKVCEAMSYAHDKGVIHRDLKPANVMVGRYGEVYVMDWGLAKILGRKDARDLRLRPPDSSSLSVIRSDRQEHAGTTPDSPLYTMDGDVVGTPAYMPPEQALGQLDELGPRSDIYALGAMLYHLLAGHMPYADSGERVTNYAIWRWVREGPPKSLHALAPAAALELVAICEKAMERDAARRYPSMEALAEDLSAWLEGRVVQAYETGAWAQARKWIRRNRLLAGALAGGVLALLGGLIASSLLAVRAGKSARRAEQSETQAEVQRDEFQRQAYVANVRLAEAALRKGDLGELRRFLAAAPVLLRDWEWRHLDAAAEASEIVLTGPERFCASALSPDGALLATGEPGGRIVLWDLASRETLRVLEGHRAAIRQATFSPDGLRLLSASADGTAGLWDCAQGTRLHELRAGDEAVESAVFSPDGMRIVLVSADGTARLWDARDGEPIAELRSRERTAVLPGVAAFAPDSRRLAVGHQDGSLRVWDADANLLWTKNQHKGPITFVAFAPDGRWVATASRDRTVRTWTLADGGAFLPEPLESPAPIRAVAVRADGLRLALGCEDGSVSLWDMSSGRELVARQLHSGPIVAASFAADGARLFTASEDGTVGISSPERDSQALLLLGHTGALLSLQPDARGRRLASLAQDGSVRVWDPQQAAGEVLLREHVEGVHLGALGLDGALAATTSSSRLLAGEVQLWDTTTGEVSAEPLRVGTSVSCLALSPLGDRVATCSEDGLVSIRDIRLGRVLAQLGDPADGIRAIDFSRDGARIAVLLLDGSARIWAVPAGDPQAVAGAPLAGRELLALPGRTPAAASDPSNGSSGALVLVALSSSGSLALAVQDDGSARVLEVDTGTVTATLPEAATGIRAAAFSPDDGRVAMATSDGTVLVWSLREGSGLVRLEGHEATVNSLCFSAAGHRLATASDDGTVRLWDPAQGEQLLALDAGPRAVVATRFADDGAAIVALTRDAVVCWWRAPPGGQAHEPAARQE